MMEPAKSIDDAIQSAIKQLISKQTVDGGWHSEHYGALKDGAATTALVLYALSHLPKEAAKHRAALLRGSLFLEPHIKKNGYVSNVEGADYATYGSAMLLLADTKFDLKLKDEIKTKLCKYIVAAQLGKKHGYTSSHIDFGGWDLMGWAQSPRPTSGSNISVTCLAIEALEAARWQNEEADAARKRTLVWLERCRGVDGGFFFHPSRQHLGNKAGLIEDKDISEANKDAAKADQDKANDDAEGHGEGTKTQMPKSYGTATCDGLRILNTLCDPESKLDSDKISATVKWIEEHDHIDVVPGFSDKENKHGWGLGLRYYFIQSLAKALPSISAEKRNALAKEITKQLIAEQKKDGSWASENSRMREDDPLITTSFCLIALAEIRNLSLE